MIFLYTSLSPDFSLFFDGYVSHLTRLSQCSSLKMGPMYTSPLLTRCIDSLCKKKCVDRKANHMEEPHPLGKLDNFPLATLLW